MKKYKFIIKPPVKKDFQKEILSFKKNFDSPEDFSEKIGQKNAKNLAERAVKEGFTRIVVVGGDGLLNEAINGIMEGTGGKIPQDLALGIIPTGTGNNFAKALGISKDIKKAFQIIKNEKTTLVDVGRVNQRFFINVVGFGLDAKVNKIANQIKEKYHFLPKEGSYLLPALKEIIVKIPLFKLEIKGNGIDLEEKVVLAAVSNGSSYGAIFKIAPKATLNDGKLDLCLIKSVGRIRALFDIYQVIKGTHIHLPEVKMLKASSLTISSPQPLPYLVDGEVFEPEQEYKISVFKKAIRVLVL